MIRETSNIQPTEACCRCAICWVLHETNARAVSGRLVDTDRGRSGGGAPAWVQDYALFLLDADGQIVAWYAGAERIYGCKSSDVIGRDASIF